MWRFVFLDQTTSDHARVVTVATKASSEHPDTLQAFGAVRSENVALLQVIPQNKLLFDSDQALELVRRNSKLKSLKSARYQLLQSHEAKETIWHLSFYGENPEPIASFRVDAMSGAISLSENADKVD